MLQDIIFCAAVSLALIVVLLLALYSPVPRDIEPDSHRPPWMALNLYIQQPHFISSTLHSSSLALSDAGALVFRRTLTEGPDNTSRVVGKAQGFIIPMERFAHSDFNIIYLTFESREYSGSLTLQAKDISEKGKAELPVVGGTGSFAFARGVAAFRQSDGLNATYYIRLHLQLPNRSQTIQGVG